MKFIQHIPSFCEGFTPLEVEGSIEEITKHPRIAKWADDPKFHRWSLSVDPYSTCLMAEFDKGKRWFVVGYLNEVPADLPRWDVA